jgi:hypothetical protein
MSRKKFKVQKRFELWVETTIRADSLAQAVEIAGKMGSDEFIEYLESTEKLDETSLDGTGVIENW